MVEIHRLFSEVPAHVGTGFINRAPRVFIEFRTGAVNNQLNAETGINSPDLYASGNDKTISVIRYCYSVTDFKIPERIHIESINS